MNVNRREFVALTCGVAVGCAAGCASEPAGPTGPPSVSAGPVDAGPALDYSGDVVYDHFHRQGFFVVREGARLFALSSICTHRRCPLHAQPDRSFYCKCHGSTFSPEGHVTEGPAVRDLAVLPSTVDGNGHLIVG